MKIITVPHPTLRATAQVVTQADKKLRELLHQLEDTLRHTSNPPGVGLAAPQIDVNKRVFATFLPSATTPTSDDEQSTASEMRLFINPEILDHSDQLTLGPDRDQPLLEGCLSIPNLYGPVPRWERVRLRYQQLEGDELVSYEEDFSDFPARVVQHEFDHLDGILFTDYSLEFDLPVYQGENRSDKLVEIDKELLKAL